ncbi:hypothetical protein GGS23DRAFT_563690 [Durotheca rogersii]|uniref:uncharacterized protein n=1 Tax=Durotheca rogersii TaxID=419775 RepID=UPI00221F7EE7|nr:uncharacterized protein GGS23DRAFT_563690 [Durotheca rogersii]KAI5864287.1 hypothetical protein GGS23DRAFT_563690 [Durotheca rogersii]
MQLSTATFLPALLSALASATLAAPLSMAAPAATEWTIQSLSRTCDEGDKTCQWEFGINTGEDRVAPVHVKYIVDATKAAPASRAAGGPQTFGKFTVTSTWSGQFGEGLGFTTLSIVDYAKKLIVYPAYTDGQLASGAVVTPDQSYPVYRLP